MRQKNSVELNQELWKKIILKEAEKGYIAGMIDGEGSICLSLRKDKRHFNQITPTIQISNNNKEMLEWIQNKLEGIGCIHKGKTNCYIYEIWTPVIIEKLLYELLPYLLIKGDQAKVMLNFLKNKVNRYKLRTRDSNGCFNLASPIPDFYYSSYQKMKELNSRGKGGYNV